MPAPSPSASSPRDVLVGVGLMCGALACFSLLDSSVKWAMRQGLPALEMVWVRYAGAFILCFLTAPPSQWRSMLHSNRPWMQLLRSVFLFGATISNFIALQTMQLAETTAIIFSMPLIVALASGPLLGEWVGPRRLVAILIGFVGVLVVTRPGLAGFKPAAALSFLGAVSYSCYILTTRLLANADDPRTALLHSTFVGVVAVAPFMPSTWRWPESFGQGAVMVVVAAFGALGHWLIILAHRRAPAATLAPFTYVQIFFMIAAGWALFGDVPTQAMLIGAGIVVASGLYLLARERKVKGEAATPSSGASER